MTTQTIIPSEALDAIQKAYDILCSGKPPHSARESNARRVLRQALNTPELPRTSSAVPAVGAKASCPTCNGTGDQGGNPSYGACDDCGGSGWLYPFPSTEPSEAMVEAAWNAANAAAPHPTIAASHDMIRAALRAALNESQSK